MPLPTIIPQPEAGTATVTAAAGSLVRTWVLNCGLCQQETRLEGRQPYTDYYAKGFKQVPGYGWLCPVCLPTLIQ